MPKPSVAPHHLVMMRTFSARLRNMGRSPIGRPARALASEAGDTLIEVMISAVLVALIVVGTFSGLDSTNKATSRSRARSQADALAEHAEEQLRSEPIARLVALSESHPLTEAVTENGSAYTIVSTAKYVENETTSSCNTSSTAKAEYLQTTSTVTSPLIGSGKSVAESSIISPPAGSALIVNVTGASGEAVPGMTVKATPTTKPSEAETSSNGCAFLAASPGEYTLNVSKAGYVDQNGYEESNKDPVSDSPFYVVAEETVKKSYEFAPAAELVARFQNPSSKVGVQGDTFLALNTSMTSPSYKTFGTLGTFVGTVASGKTLFPFKSRYTVYAGTCPADAPTANGQSSNPEIELTGGGHAEVPVPEPAINVLVKSGEAVAGKEGSTVEANGTLIDTGCEHEAVTAKRTIKTTTAGVLEHSNMPYGTYSLCVTAVISGKARKSTVVISNNKESGSTLTKIYLGTAEENSKGCP